MVVQPYLFIAVTVALVLIDFKVDGFAVTPAEFQQWSRHCEHKTSPFELLASRNDGGNDSRPSSRQRSRLEGNQRAPTEEELRIMDQMIDKLANAKPYELPNAVRRAFRVISSPQFFLRIASRADAAASSSEEKEKLSALAANLVSTLDAVVSTTEEQLDERAKEVQRVVKAAAEPDSGEFLVPLLPERIQAMRKELEALEESSLDEGFLSTLDSWMMKSQQDGLELMVGILQKVLQMYAGTQIARARARQTSGNEKNTAGAGELLDELLKTDADDWDSVIQRRLLSDADGSLTANHLMAEVQRTTESIILSLEAGSMTQRVQAEFMQELMKRIDAVQQNQ